MKAASFRSSSLPSVRRPVHRSTPNGRTVRMASATLSGVSPPARKTGTGTAVFDHVQRPEEAVLGRTVGTPEAIHEAGFFQLVLLAVLAPIAFVTDNLMVGGLTTLIMMLVAGWESVSRRRARAAH